MTDKIKSEANKMSVWEQTVSIPQFLKLDGDIHTDVLIIGGGITGVLTAYFLHQNGVKYALVEKSRICSGITCKTTAKITAQHGLVYHKILADRGAYLSQKYLKANELALEKYCEICKNFDCDFERKDNYVYSVYNRRILEKEMKALEKIRSKAEFCENIIIPKKTVGAVKFPNQAQFNLIKFIAAISEGLNIFENTFVNEMIGTTAVTQSGKIYADKVIAATHFPFINKHGNYFLKLYQHRSYVVALKNAQNIDGMYVDENKKGMSFRNYGKLLLLGGGGHRTGKQGGNWCELRAFAKTVYPKAREECFWATQDCMSLDRVPYIGQYSKRTPNFYVASGFNKWGMTSAMVSAMILKDIVLEKKNDFAEVFNPSRNILKPQLFANGFEATKNLLTVSEHRCPHLGCALKWNRAENSWDCPCHGSRFSENGEVLDNPANGTFR